MKLEFPYGLCCRENERQTFRKGRRLTKRDGVTPKDARCAKALAVLRELGLVGDGEYVEIFKAGSPRITTTTEYRKGKEALADCAALQVKRPWPAIPEQTEVEAHGIIYPPLRARPDAGAFSKIVLDAVESIVYPNDYWVTRMTWERAGTDRINPRVELTVNPRGTDGQTNLFE